MFWFCLFFNLLTVKFPFWLFFFSFSNYVFFWYGMLLCFEVMYLPMNQTNENNLSTWLSMWCLHVLHYLQLHINSVISLQCSKSNQIGDVLNSFLSHRSCPKLCHWKMIISPISVDNSLISIRCARYGDKCHLITFIAWSIIAAISMSKEIHSMSIKVCFVAPFFSHFKGMAKPGGKGCLKRLKRALTQPKLWTWNKLQH